MPQTQDGDQIEQDQIAQFERPYKLGAVCVFFVVTGLEKRNKMNYSGSIGRRLMR